MIGLLAERRGLVAHQRNDGRTLCLAELQRLDRFLRRARQRRDHHNRAGTKPLMARRHEFGGDFHIGRKRRAPLQQQRRRLHEDGGTTSTEEKDVAGSSLQTVTDGHVNIGSERYRTGLNLEKARGIKVQHHATAGQNGSAPL